MRWLRPLLVSLVASAACPLACGSSAIGVEDCRSIERARCQAARGCNVGIDTTADEQTCERFARDNCLHGMLVAASTAGAVTECVHSINVAGACVAKKTALADCTGIGKVTNAKASVCDVIVNPEQITACEFLTETPKPAPTSTPKDSGSD